MSLSTTVLELAKRQAIDAQAADRTPHSAVITNMGLKTTLKVRQRANCWVRASSLPAHFPRKIQNPLLHRPPTAPQSIAINNVASMTVSNVRQRANENRHVRVAFAAGSSPRRGVASRRVVVSGPSSPIPSGAAKSI